MILDLLCIYFSRQPLNLSRRKTTWEKSEFGCSRGLIWVKTDHLRQESFLFSILIFSLSVPYFPPSVLLRNNWRHCINLRGTAWWFDLHVLWNDYYNRLISIISYIYNKKKNKDFSLWWELLGSTLLSTLL